jgi:NAD(P)-dependent dehydrogenase (short-subunit alcohol dehydrogenase family)
MIEINRCGMVYPDQVVIITGGSKGIGEGCARVFVDAGAKVVICARGTEAGEKLCQELNEKGPGSCVFIPCDVAVAADIQNVVEKTISLYGKIDCLINNAGYHPQQNLIDQFDEEGFRDVFQTNMVSYFTAAKLALPHLRKSRGNIINMGSLTGIMGEYGGTTYCATKGAIASFTKTLAIEESVNGVRVNCVSPGNIISYGRVIGEQKANDPEGFKRRIDSHQVTGRSGTNEEVGQLCLFLATDAASYITGVDIIISGGSELGYGVKYPLRFYNEAPQK